MKGSRHQVVRVVVTLTGDTARELRSRNKSPSVAYSRHLGYWLLREHCRCSWRETAEMFDRKSHSTAMRGLDCFKRQLDTDPNTVELALRAVELLERFTKEIPVDIAMGTK